MSILIIGDSFAGHGNPVDHATVSSYQTLLRKKYNLSVDNYSYPGHSFYKAYRKLCDIQDESQLDKYKLIVFIVTTPGRLYFPNANYGVSSLENAQSLLKKYKNNKYHYDHAKYPSYDRILAAMHYYEHLQSFKYDQFVHNLMEENLRKVLKEINIDHIILPVSQLSFETAPSWSLLDMCLKQIELFDNSPTDFQFGKYEEKYGKILNHLTVENNEVLAEFIYQNYTGNKLAFDEQVFAPSKINDFYHYYNKLI